MERRFLRPAHSYKIFREDCGFTMEDWTSFHEVVQNVLLEPRNYVALQKPYVHREAWEKWLQNFIDTTGVVDVYWPANGPRKWDVAENGEVIRAFVRDVVITLAKEISRARNRIAREVNYVKNIEPPEFPASAQSEEDDPEPDILSKVKTEGSSMASGTVEKWPHPGSVIRAAKLEEEAPSFMSNVAPIIAPPASLPPASLPSLSPGEPPVKLLPVREVVDIERYDPDAPIELIPEGYVRQFVIDDNGGSRNNIILLKDPAYNGSPPNKRLEKELLEGRNLLQSNDDPQDLSPQITNSSPTPTITTPSMPWGHWAQGCPEETLEGLPRPAVYTSSREDTPVPTERKHSWVTRGDNKANKDRMGVKHEIESDDDDEGDEDYRGDDEDETVYARGGTGTNTEGEREFANRIPRRRHKYSLRKRLQVL